MTARFKSFTFTLNNYTEDDIASLKALKYDYIIFGKEEAPTTGTPHLQGYIYFKDSKTTSSLNKKVHFSYLVGSRGSCSHNVNYCKKDADFFEDGAKPSDAESRNESQRQLWKAIRENAERGSFDLIPDRIRVSHYSALQSINRNYTPPFVLDNQLTAALIASRPWQQDLLTELLAPAHHRTITWYTDLEGGKGKSSFADYVQDNHNAWVFNSGKFADLAYLCPKQPTICILNLFNADQGPDIPYTFLESLKDGRVQSTKYEPILKRFPRPHVVVFSNFEPDMHKLKADRWILRTI